MHVCLPRLVPTFSYAKLVGKEIPVSRLQKVAREIKRFAQVIANFSQPQNSAEGLRSALNMFTTAEADSLFGGFINFTE